MTRRQFSVLLAGIWTAGLLAACGSTGSKAPASESVADAAPTVSPPSTDALIPTSDRTTPSRIGPTGVVTAAQTVAAQGVITVTIGTAEFSATLADTQTARAFADRLPLIVNMSDVNSNEKAVQLDEALPGVAANPGTITNGDLMLYGSSTIVLFYASFDTSYAYSRIGRLNAPDGLAEVLGASDVTVTFAHP